MHIRQTLHLKFGADLRNNRLLSFDNLQGEDHIKLAWTQTTRRKTEYILQSKIGCLATFAFNPSQAPYAIAELPDERIYLKYTKYPLPKATISKNRNNGMLAIFEPDLDWQGKLDCENGHQFIWISPSQREIKSSFLNLNGIHLVDFYRAFGFLKLGATVHIHPIVRKHPQLPYLILMGWFLNLIR